MYECTVCNEHTRCWLQNVVYVCVLWQPGHELGDIAILLKDVETFNNEIVVSTRKVLQLCLLHT